MKILSLGLDNSVLNKNSPLAKRIVEYGGLVEKYTVIALNKENKRVVLSEKALVVGVGAGNKIFALFKIYTTAKRLLKKEKLVLENHRGFDVITVQDQYYLALIGWILAKKFSIGLEIQVHGFEKYYGSRKLIAKFVIPRANAVRAVSQRLKKRLVSEFEVQEDRITVVPIYINADDADKTRLPRRFASRNDKFVFLTVGRLVPVKNIEMQIGAIAEVVKQCKDVELWIVGDGPEMRNLKFEAVNTHCNVSVRFFGWQDDLEKFYGQADVFLLSSNSEGWGMAVIEATSYGLPIIMTDVGCAGEVIKNGESGIVIPVGGQKKLEQAMIRLVKDKELREKLGENALQAVKNLLSKEDILALYKKSWEMALIDK